MGKQPNEGEGNRTAAREYNKKTEEFAQSGRVEKAAKDARHALEGAEGKDLRNAEAEAKARGKGMESPDDLH